MIEPHLASTAIAVLGADTQIRDLGGSAGWAIALILGVSGIVLGIQERWADKRKLGWYLLRVVTACVVGIGLFWQPPPGPLWGGLCGAALGSLAHYIPYRAIIKGLTPERFRKP
ncbi:MAG: hypothetical protein ACI9MR_000050 [Myxococcota bacterium]|jgi:hypothetical protein